uniref:Uncharacterized protein n=1 Tax=Schizophyllum commune (strain H4-8 / FGSC 9210) TaxID=578458 RepID=D8QKM7_SCHCM
MPSKGPATLSTDIWTSDTGTMSSKNDPILYKPPFPSLPVPQPPPSSYDPFRGTETPLVIDNGSTTFRYGFATSKEPRTSLNVMARYKERKTNKPLLLFGDGIEVESGAKAQAKYPWEGDVLLNFDALENVLDCAFVNLGIDTDTVEHPILMTERIATPIHSRTLTSELLFEQYSVPSVAYCLDGVMSFYERNKPSSPGPFTADGLVISFNTASTSVIPILNGRGILSHAKRLQWGTSQASDYLLKLVQLKYPTFPTRVTPVQASWMLERFCLFATDYKAQMRALRDPIKLREVDCIIQYPFTQPAWETKTEEELARAAERRKEQGKRLQEIAAKNRQDKAAKKEEDLENLIALRDSRDEMDINYWLVKLEEHGISDESELDEAIEVLEAEIKKAKRKDADGDELMDEPQYPLVDVPDEELDADQLKEKKKQKLLKAGQEARIRARKEKEKEREIKEREERAEQQERATDLDGWSRRHRQEHEARYSINQREKHKEALADRRSAAAQARMKSIATLAADERVPKRGRKVGGDDTFGANDADWDEYRKIDVSAPAEDQEEDLKRLMAIEEKLLVHDPTFTEEHTHAAIQQQRSPLLCAFKPGYSEWDVGGANRIHLNTERYRACETWFSPFMAGLDSAGLGEVIQNILARFTYEEKGRLVKNIFLTGTPSKFPGLVERLQTTMRPIMPPEMPIEIVRANEPSLDAWKGMASFAQTEEFRTVGVTRQEYEEHGGERIRRWWGGNWNGATL